MNLLEHSPDLLTVQEAAEILRADPATVESYISAGEIKHAEIAGKTLIPRRFLEEFVANSCKTCYNESVEIHTPAPDGQAARTLTTEKTWTVCHFKERV